jgi:hypothetical protein
LANGKRLRGLDDRRVVSMRRVPFALAASPGARLTEICEVTARSQAADSGRMVGQLEVIAGTPVWTAVAKEKAPARQNASRGHLLGSNIGSN